MLGGRINEIGLGRKAQVVIKRQRKTDSLSLGAGIND